MSAPAAAAAGGAIDGMPFVAVEDRWVQCERCNKWRRVTDEKADVSADPWYCEFNTWDPAHNNCDAEEENSEDDDVAQAALREQKKAEAAFLAAEEAKAARMAKKPGKKKKKKRGSDSEEDDESAENSADEAFYMELDAAAAAETNSRTRRSSRATRVPEQYVDYGEDDMLDDDAVVKPKKSAVPKKATDWSSDADDALLSAIVKHGLGNWTAMLKDPEFAPRFGDLKAGSLRNRWRKLGTSSFTSSSSDQKLEAKREEVFNQLAGAPTPAAAAAAPSSSPVAVPNIAARAASGAMIPPPGPLFVAYRPYPSHVFDLAKKKGDKAGMKKETSADGDIDLSTPSMPSKPKGRGRRKKKGSDDDSFGASDASDDSGAEGRMEGGASSKRDVKDSEFVDMEENLDNLAYMWYYDHRNAAMQLYDFYHVPLRQLKQHLTNAFSMKNQDALELIKAMGESRDLYSRRNLLSKAMQHHMTHHTTSQSVRMWLQNVKGMTTQALHKTHEAKLKQDQQNRVLEQQARQRYEQVHGVPMPVEVEDYQNASPAQQHQHAVHHQHPIANATPTKRAPPLKKSGVAGTTGQAAFDALPYYWRHKLESSKKLGLPFPEVTGNTANKLVLQQQLDEIRLEWDTMPMTAMILRITVPQLQEMMANGSFPPPQQQAAATAAAPMQSAVAAQLAATQQYAVPMNIAQPAAAAMGMGGVPAPAAVPTMTAASPSLAAGAAAAAAAAAAAQTKAQPPKKGGRRSKKSTSDDDIDSDSSEALAGVSLGAYYPLPNLRLKKLGVNPLRYEINRIVEVNAPLGEEDEDVNGENAMTDV